MREARIDLTGALDARLECPLLSLDDQFAETLLANSDRGRDPTSSYRDALDLGMLISAHGGQIPDAAGRKAVEAYGEDVWRDARRTAEHLHRSPGDLERAAAALRMDRGMALAAVGALSREIDRAGGIHRDHPLVPFRL